MYFILIGVKGCDDSVVSCMLVLLCFKGSAGL